MNFSVPTYIQKFLFMRRRVVPLQRGTVAYNSPLHLGAAGRFAASSSSSWPTLWQTFLAGFVTAVIGAVWILWPFLD